MEPSEFLQGGTVSVSTETYAVCRTDQPHPSAFATVRDGAETTVVIGIDLPFEWVGFLVTVATALADAGVSVFVISSFAADHVFIKATDIPVAVSELEESGCRVETGAQVSQIHRKARSAAPRCYAECRWVVADSNCPKKAFQTVKRPFSEDHRPPNRGDLLTADPFEGTSV